MKKNRIIYSITVEDVCQVALEKLGLEPNEEIVKFVEEHIGDKIAWFDYIESLLTEFKRKSSTGLTVVR
jgi:hypothetical protein